MVYIPQGSTKLRRALENTRLATLKSRNDTILGRPRRVTLHTSSSRFSLSVTITSTDFLVMFDRSFIQTHVLRMQKGRWSLNDSELGVSERRCPNNRGVVA